MRAASDPVLVSKDEARLLRWVTGVFRPPLPAPAATGKWTEPQPPTGRISDLLRERLASGAIDRLARSSLLSDADFAQRPPLWERHEAPTLEFTDAVLTLATFDNATAVRPSNGASPGETAHPIALAGSGDRLLAFCRAHDNGRPGESLLIPEIDEPACWLMMPRRSRTTDSRRVQWWLAGVGGVCFEAIQRDLGLGVAAAIRRMRNFKVGVAPGAWIAIVDAFADQALERKRLDLTRWIGIAIRELVAGPMPESRATSFREAGLVRDTLLVLPNALERIDRWLDQDRAAGYVDDGYDDAQARLREWESWGPAARIAARRLTEHAHQQAQLRTEATDDPPATGEPETT